LSTANQSEVPLLALLGHGGSIEQRLLLGEDRMQPNELKTAVMTDTVEKVVLHH
jgi:hypothetical protein